MSDNSTPAVRFDGFTNAWELRQASHAVPAVQFTADDGSAFPEWEEKKLGDVLEVHHGRDYKQLDPGNIPVMGTGGVITYVDKALCDWDCVCIGRKGTINKPIYMTAPFWSVDTLFFTKAKKNHHPLWQYYLFQMINWDRYNEATGVPSLSSTTIESIRISVPSLPEQKKIASLLSSVDGTIDLCQRKLDLLTQAKKALIQQIFSRKLRFKADDGSEFPDWEEKNIGDIGEVITGSTPSTKHDEYFGDEILWATPVDLNDQLVLKNTTRKLSKLGYSKVRKLPEGSVLVSCIASIGKVGVLPESGSCNQQINAVIPEPDIDSLWLGYAMLPKKPTLEMLGGNGGLKIVNKTLFENMHIFVPSLPEQKKIASCLSSADVLIDQARVELEQWQDVKKSLLQQLFV